MSSAPFSPVINYCSVQPEIRCPQLGRAAFWLGLIPLCVGIGITLLWIVTAWQALPICGLFTILGGVACFGVGVICLTVYFFANLGLKGDDRREVWRRTTATALLLLINFPAAWLCIQVAQAAHNVHV
jgi:hypothetical protein